MTATNQDAAAGSGTAPLPAPLTGAINHVGVQTADLTNAIAWYQDFLGARVSWEMNQGFSALSQRRLPGLSRLVEVTVADIRLHLFTRDIGPAGPPPAEANQFQHVCLRVATAEELRRWRRHWFSLYESGRYTFVRPEPASEIDTDAVGMQSFYAYDVNGLEYEFTYLPDGVDGDA